MVAESLATELAIDLAISSTWSAIIISGDAKCIIDSLDRRDSYAHWVTIFILDDCLVKFNSFLFWTTIFIPRTTNMLVHNIVK